MKSINTKCKVKSEKWKQAVHVLSQPFSFDKACPERSRRAQDERLESKGSARTVAECNFGYLTGHPEPVEGCPKSFSTGWKILSLAISSLLFAILLSGCVAFQVGGEITKGRLELIHGDPKVALPYFQRAASLDPNYITNFTVFREGVWTYVGRANYGSGNLPEARKALEQARSRYEHDYMARLYLGLVLSRQGERERGSKEIAAGLKGLGEWFGYIENYTREGRYWDPTKKIQGEIRKSLAMINGRELKWEELTQNVEWIGRELEREIDRVREDEREDRDRESDNGRP